jgi:diguanylate cyclase (GGDEF)-like protein
LSAYVETGQSEEYYLCWGAKRRTSTRLLPDDAFLQAMTKIMIGAIKNREYEATLTQLAMTDSLTRVYNRHHFTECLAKALEQHHRTKQPYALLMLDLDHFKDINDTYGHPAGDAVLQYFANALRGKLREIDMIGRLGGEEFGVILPDTDAAAALSIAERLREDMQNAEVIIDGDHIKITVCIGVTVLDEGDADTGQPMSRADDALYCAKEEGRNRVKRRISSNERTDLSI